MPTDTDTTDTNGPLGTFFAGAIKYQRYPGKTPRFYRDDVAVWRCFEPLAWDALQSGTDDAAAYWIAQYAAHDQLEMACALRGHAGIRALITIARTVSRFTDD